MKAGIPNLGLRHAAAMSLFLICWLAGIATDPARAELGEELRNWGAGPARFLFTAADVEAWRQLTDDEAARQFVQLFWAKRDPDPKTPENELFDEFRRRVSFSDQKFAREAVRGAMTPPGHVFIVLGPPTRMRTTGSAGSLTGGDAGVGDDPVSVDGSVASGGGPGRFGSGSTTDRLGAATSETWTYEDEDVPAVLKRKRFSVSFRSKPGTDQVELWDSNEALTALTEVAQSFVVDPELTVADLPGAAPEGTRAWRGKAIEDAARLESLARAARESQGVDIEAAAFRASDGTWIVPVQLSTTESVEAVGSPVLIGEVMDSDGKRVLAFELAEPWEEAGGQRFLQETLVLPPGTYKLRAGVADATGQVRWAAEESVTVPAGGSEFWISDLILGHEVVPMKEAQQMLEPFAWQGIAVVPRSGEKFRGGEVWMYIHACNVSLDAAGKPQLRVIAQLTGPKGFRGPLRVEPSDTGAGCWVVAQALDASAFEAGDYSMRLQVTDTGAGKTLTADKEFTILK